MEVEPLISGSRWALLRYLSQKPCSPTELAEKMGTTLANVSQQLRMLEMAGIVKKERQPSREKGKPRMLFSLAGSFAHLSLMSPSCSEKKLVLLDRHHEAFLRIWLLTEEQFHKKLESFCSSAESIPGVAIYAEPSSGRIFAICRDKNAEKKISDIKTDAEVMIGEEKKVPSNYVRIL